jgi:hypothetical protein
MLVDRGAVPARDLCHLGHHRHELRTMTVADERQTTVTTFEVGKQGNLYNPV